MDSLDSLKRIKEEFNFITIHPDVNIGLTVSLPEEGNYYKWRASFIGPKDTPYKMGLFYLEIIFPKDYPNMPPEIHFKTPIYHPNVNNHKSEKEALGNVRFSDITSWNPSTSMRKVLIDLYGIFYLANPESPQSLKIAKEYKENKGLYQEKIIYFTKKYANPLNRPNQYNNDWDFSYDDNKYISGSIETYEKTKYKGDYDKDKIIDLYIPAFGGNKQMIQCKMSEKTRNVIERFKEKYSIEIKMDSKDTLFIFSGKQIDLDFTIGENGFDQISFLTKISVVEFT